VDGESRPRIEHRLPSRTVRWYLITGLIVLFLLSVGTFIVLVGRDIEPDTLLFEGAKVLPQIALVTVIGAALSLLSYEYQQRRKEEEQEREERRQQAEKKRRARSTGGVPAGAPEGDLGPGDRELRSGQARSPVASGRLDR
jgi:membrane protein implicated in regulation of membrane protease activity